VTDTRIPDILERLDRLERASRHAPTTSSGAYLTIDQASGVTSICSATLRRAIKVGELRAFNVSKGAGRATWRIDRADLDAFMRTRQAEPVATLEKAEAT
jgi:excisionase family DNA binding protein